MSNRNRTPRTAALLLSIAIGGASLSMLPGASAVDAPDQVVKRLSAVKGVAGETVLVQGTKLATFDDNGTAADTTDDKWVAEAVQFLEADGTTKTAVAAGKVAGVSATTLELTLPTHANGAVTVLVGDAVKGPKFTYSAPITVSTNQAALKALAPVSETGLADAVITGTNFTKATKVVVGGKAAKINKDGLKADGTEIKFAYPAGLSGVQDVVVSDPSKTIYVGYVTYSGQKPTIGTVTGTSYVEVASTVEITGGTNLDLVTGVTYEGVKAGFKVYKEDATKLTVTIPAGAAAASGSLVVSTKYGETATKTVARVAASKPTVSAPTVTKDTAGTVTVTGTNLNGLKKVVVTKDGKPVSGVKFAEVAADGKSFKLTVPALAAGDYKIVVTAISATSSDEVTFTVAA